MALVTDMPRTPSRTPSPDRIVPRPEDHFLAEDDRPDAGRSNFAAFLLGGGVIAFGMLAFLYYDNENLTRGEDITTGSIGRMIQGAPASPNGQLPPRSLRPAGEP